MALVEDVIMVTFGSMESVMPLSQNGKPRCAPEAICDSSQTRDC